RQPDARPRRHRPGRRRRAHLTRPPDPTRLGVSASALPRHEGVPEMTAYTPQATGSGPKAAVQRFGSHLAGMVMPNIGAFIAWGLITALFIETGWTPVAEIGGFDGHEGLVGPMIRFLLPLLIGYTGGRMVH